MPASVMSTVSVGLRMMDMDLSCSVAAVRAELLLW
jgi:hypothetical protein